MAWKVSFTNSTENNTIEHQELEQFGQNGRRMFETFCTMLTSIHHQISPWKEMYQITLKTYNFDKR